jgi:hypothetical protein
MLLLTDKLYYLFPDINNLDLTFDIFLCYQSESDVTIASVSSFDVDAKVLAAAVFAVRTFVFVVA